MFSRPLLAAAAAVLCTSLSLVGCHRDPERAKAAHLQRADDYASRGKWAEAVLELRGAVDRAPQSGEVRVKLADALLAHGNAGEALREYVRASDLLPSDLDVQLKTGNLLLLAGRFDDAKVRADKVLAVRPQSAAAQVLLANALAGLKDFSAAIVEIEEAIRLDPAQGSAYSSLGAFEMGRGRVSAAETAFKKATELDTSSARAQLALANFFWMQRRWPEVEQALGRALEIEPGSVQAHRAMASFAIEVNRPAVAEKHLKRVLELTGSPEAALTLADFYAARKDDASARDLLGPLSTSQRGATAAGIRLAALDHASGRQNEAYARLDEILGRDARNLEALLVKGALLQGDKRPDAALAAADAAVQAHGNSASAFFLLARIQESRRQMEQAVNAYKNVLRLNPRATGAQLALSRMHLAAGRAGDSVSFAEDALKHDPENPTARLTLTGGLIAQGDLARAERELTDLRERYPSSAAVLVQQGMLLGRKRDAAGARRAFEEAMSLDPHSAAATAGLLSLDLAAGREDAVRERARQIEQAPQPRADMLLVVGRVYAATNDLTAAERVFRRALEVDANALAAYGALGQIYVRQGRLDAALEEIDLLARRDPRPVAAHTLAGMILLTQRRTADAKARFEQAIRIDDEAPVAANNLAWIIAEEGGNLDVALQLAQTAKRGLPTSAEVSDTLGVIYYRKDLLPQAIRELRAAVEQDSARAAFHHHLAKALAKAGDTAGARDHVNRALQLEPDSPAAAESREMLRTLPSR